MREPATPRSTAAANALTAASQDLGQVLSASIGQSTWALLLAFRALKADDQHGRAQGYVIQHDELRWADLLDVLEAAAPLIQQQGHPLPTCTGTGCATCRATRALPRLRRIWTDTGLHAAQVRANVNQLGDHGVGTG